MDDIRIPNDATYSPIALTDVMVAAPIAARVLLGATLPGRVLQAAAFGLYAGSVAKDWTARQGMKRIDFRAEFGSDVDHLVPQSDADRRSEIARLGVLLNEGWTDDHVEQALLAKRVDEVLTDYMASITGQRVETSHRIRTVTLTSLVFPFAMGACDMLSGDVAIFRDTGIFAPHIIAHEFVHRKGYWKELHAQALAYLALRNSGDPYLVQAARAERLHRQLRVVAGEDPEAFKEAVDEAGLREELHDAFLALRPDPGRLQSIVSDGMKQMYDMRLKLTGQNGLSDYDLGFTNFLHTFAQSSSARQPAEQARL
ncbi:DUF3810 family protein [Gemmatimonadota bacterium DH-20]|uniref:DUF3810 family protein n=1 Tax=Gaopeijia maritima TaxID=3119007 RepID=A0ABU9EBS8_9BACT